MQRHAKMCKDVYLSIYSRIYLDRYMEINLLKAMNHPNIVNHPQRTLEPHLPRGPAVAAGPPQGGPGPLHAARGPGPMVPLRMVDDVCMVHRFQKVDLHISIQIYPAMSVYTCPFPLLPMLFIILVQCPWGHVAHGP